MAALLFAAAVCAAPLIATAAPKAPRPGMTDCSSAQQGEILNRIGVQAYQQCTQHGGMFACDATGFACCGPSGCDNFVTWFKRLLPRLTPGLQGGGTLRQ